MLCGETLMAKERVEAVLISGRYPPNYSEAVELGHLDVCTPWGRCRDQ